MVEQVARSVLTAAHVDSSSLRTLRDGLGIAQHHDAVSGTAKQAPAFIFFEPLEILENFDHFQHLQFWKSEGVEN